MTNLGKQNFNPDNICLPPGRPANLVDFPTGEDYAFAETHPGSVPSLPPIFADMGGPDYQAILEGIEAFNRAMHAEMLDMRSKVPELNNPITVSFEDVGGDAQPDTNINIGGNSFNVGGANINIAGDQNLNQFLFPPQNGVRRASVVPATAMTQIEGAECDGNAPGVGMANLLYRLTVANFNNQMQNKFVALKDAIFNAKQTGDWTGVQELAQEWSDMLHNNGGLQQDPDDDDHDETVTQMVFNISNSSIPSGTRMLCSPDANGQLWVVVASCGDCE